MATATATVVVDAPPSAVTATATVVVAEPQTYYLQMRTGTALVPVQLGIRQGSTVVWVSPAVVP